MFGYVLPSRDRLDERERERFRAVYCGLCHTLRERYGFAASLLLNYDFTLLAILLSSGDEEPCTVRHCAMHPCKGCRAQTSTPALEAAADRTVILSWWQLRDHIADHGFWSGLKYRFALLFLRGAYPTTAQQLSTFNSQLSTKSNVCYTHYVRKDPGSSYTRSGTVSLNHHRIFFVTFCCQKDNIITSLQTVERMIGPYLLQADRGFPVFQFGNKTPMLILLFQYLPTGFEVRIQTRYAFPKIIQ